jgi:hypothetical protein
MLQNRERGKPAYPKYTATMLCTPEPIWQTEEDYTKVERLRHGIAARLPITCRKPLPLPS